MDLVSRRQFLIASPAGLCLLAGAARGETSRGWVDHREVGPFACHAAFSLAGYEELLSELAPLERELRRVLGLRPCRDSMQLYLLGDRTQYHAYLAKHFPQVPSRRALFIKQHDQANVFVYRHDELAVDLRHECTHALLHADLPQVPLWLDEGLAEYFEVSQGDRPRRHPHHRALRWNTRLGIFTPIDQLEVKTELDQFTAVDYQHAWAWVHFLLHGPPAAHAELVRYLAELRAGRDPGAFSKRLERSISDPTRQLAGHFRQWTVR